MTDQIYSMGENKEKEIGHKEESACTNLGFYS